MSKIIKCRTCGIDIASSAKTCPGCGAKNKKPIYTKWWVWAIAIVVIGAAIGGGEEASSGGTSANGTTQVKANEKKEKFEIVGDVTEESDQFATYISGVVKNNSGKDCSYAQIQFTLYDKDGNQIGTALDNINNLEKDGTWKFKAMGIGENGEVASYKLAEITGF